MLQAFAVQVSAERAAGPSGEQTTAEIPAVELHNVSRKFGPVSAVAGISLSIRRGEFFSLLGPSGCGKTTLLRLVAGLDLPDAGTVSINGLEATHTPAHQRPVNTVFQSYALFPHLNVRENIAFGLRMKRMARKQIEERVGSIMETVRISELAGRRISQLSGGQKQRVALARAIVNEPQVLLLDEPLGALDLKLRKELQVELHALQRRLGITFIYVTHDQEEALAMSDRIGVMHAGRMAQLGAAEEVYERPRTRFAAQFIGACNLLRGTVRHCSERDFMVRTELGEVRVELGQSARPLQLGQSCTLAIRPEKVRVLAFTERREVNSFPVRVSGFVYTGSETQYRLETPGGLLNAWVMNARSGPPVFQIGDRATVQLPWDALVLLDD